MSFNPDFSSGAGTVLQDSSVPPDALSQHRRQEPPDLQAMERLLAIKDELAAAKAGNTRKLRALRAERKQIEN
jgi:hypothetical protein